MFGVAPIGLWRFCVCLCLVLHYVVLFLALNHLEEEERDGCFASMWLVESLSLLYLLFIS